MLTLQFLPYAEIESLGEEERVRKLLGIVKENKIVLLEGRLRKHEEAELIKETMRHVGESFKGIELSVVNPGKHDYSFLKNLKNDFLSVLLGDRQGFTIIGPATIIKEIKKDPDKIQLLTEEVKNRRKKKAR